MPHHSSRQSDPDKRRDDHSCCCQGRCAHCSCADRRETGPEVAPDETEADC